jgi:hypothetical protein
MNRDDLPSDTPSPLAHVDAVAISALSKNALARYRAYKEVLLAREQDQAAIVSTLTLFVWDLSESQQNP